MYIAISTRYTSIQSKNIALYLKKHDFLILAKVSKKIENNFFFEDFKNFVLFTKKMFQVIVLKGYQVDITIWVAVWDETDGFFLKKREKHVCEYKCVKLPVCNA